MATGIIRTIVLAVALSLAAGCSDDDKPSGPVGPLTNARGFVRTADGAGLADVGIVFISAGENAPLGYTLADGSYSVRVGGQTVPSGAVEFRKAGYVSRRIVFPRAFIARGDRWYESDVELTPIP